MRCSNLCKTFIRRFDSDPRLQSSPLPNQLDKALPALLWEISAFCGKLLKTANVGRSAFESLTEGLTRMPIKSDTEEVRLG